MSFEEGVPCHGDLTQEREKLFGRLLVVTGKLRKRRWQLWFALCGRGCLLWTSNPNLFEVFWLPLLSVLYRRSFSPDPVFGTSVSKLWEDWKENHLPWRLRRKVERVREAWRKCFRENLDLRKRLAAREQKE